MIDKYIEKFCITKRTDYGDRKSVKQHNRAMDSCREIARKIQEQHDELKSDFCCLLDSNIPDLPLLVAHHMIEVMEYDEEQKAKALNIIYEKTKEDSVDGFGNKLWLEDYLKNNPKDQKLVNG